MSSVHSSQGSSQVHFSVTKGANRRDPHYITCLKSDGNSSKWKETGPTIDNTGATCYWKADDTECQLLAEKWKKTLGKTVAKLLGLAEDATDEDWRIHDFPKDYKLFRHVKGQREDYYLFGSEWVGKFRTANEFSPHFHWLCNYEPTKANRIHCKCKYCSGSKNQGQINSSLGIDQLKRFSSPILDQKSASQNKRKAEEEMAKENLRKRMASESNSSIKPSRVTQKPVSSRKSLPNHLLNSVTNGGVPGRRSTFSGPYVNKDRDRDLSESRCTFRMAELVWCQLDTPIEGSSEGRPDLRIDYWPGICEERVLVSNSEISSSKNSTGETSSVEFLSLKVQQKFQWKIRLLATCDVYCKDESQLLAYLNYPPPLNIYKLPIKLEALQHIHDGHETDRPTISSFTTFSDALAPFALSLQITAHIKKSFTLMDRYDIALLKRLEARGQNIPTEDVQILYEDSNLPWYQYIWWGAEKIWSGELIRLIVTASDLPMGLRPITQDIFSRCFFLKITGFYRSAREEGMVKGSIFELAPIAQKAKDQADRDPEFEESNSLPGVEQINRYMPQAPTGYFFRRLTPVGKEHHLVLQHIAGRYYPPRYPITSDPLNLDSSDPPAPFSIEGRSLILSGLGEGRWLHMHCETWTIDRKECFKEAEASAERELLVFCERPQVDEVIKTKTVAIMVSENENDGTTEILETGVRNNDNLVPEAESLIPIDPSITNGPIPVENGTTCTKDTDNDVTMESNPITFVDTCITNSSPKEQNVLPLTVTQSDHDSTSMVLTSSNHDSVHPVVTRSQQEPIPLEELSSNHDTITGSKNLDSNRNYNAIIEPENLDSHSNHDAAVEPKNDHSHSNHNTIMELRNVDSHIETGKLESGTNDKVPQIESLTAIDHHVTKGHTAGANNITLEENNNHNVTTGSNAVAYIDPRISNFNKNCENDIPLTVTSIDNNIKIQSESNATSHIADGGMEAEKGIPLVSTTGDKEGSNNALGAEVENVATVIDNITKGNTDVNSNKIEVESKKDPLIIEPQTGSGIDLNITTFSPQKQNVVPADTSSQPDMVETIQSANSRSSNDSIEGPKDVTLLPSTNVGLSQETKLPLLDHISKPNADVESHKIQVESNKDPPIIEPQTGSHIDPNNTTLSPQQQNVVPADTPIQPDMIEEISSANPRILNGSIEGSKDVTLLPSINVGLSQETQLPLIDPQFTPDDDSTQAHSDINKSTEN